MKTSVRILILTALVAMAFTWVTLRRQNQTLAGQVTAQAQGVQP